MSNDVLDQDLRAELQRRMRVQPTPLVDDPSAAVQRLVGDRQRRRRVRRAVIVASIVVVAIGTVVAFVGPTSPHRARVTSPPATRPPAPSTSTTGAVHVDDPDGVAAVSTPPLTRPWVYSRAGLPRPSPATVWTGDELVVWHGLVTSGPESVDGAAYSPTTNTWRLLPAAPLAESEAPVGALTDAGVLIISGRSTAVWNPASNTWRQLDDAPRTVLDLVSSGDEAFSYTANAFVDVRTGTWRDLPTPPVTLERVTTVWTGSELVALGLATDAPTNPTPGALGVAYDPQQRRWRQLPRPGGATAEALAAVWDGKRVVVVNYDMTALAYAPDQDRWEALPNVPARFSEWQPRIGAADGRILVIMSEAFVVLDHTGRWIPLPYLTAPPITLVGAGNVAISIGVDPSIPTNTVDLIDLASAASFAPRLQVGVGNVTRDASQHLENASYTTGDVTIAETVEITLADDSGTSCHISSTYGAAPPPTTNTVVTNDNQPTDWYVTNDGREWSTRPTTSDTFTVACQDPDQARAIAESASFRWPYS